MIFLTEISNYLQELEKEIKKADFELSLCPDGVLAKEAHGDSSDLLCKTIVNGKRHRKTIAPNSEMTLWLVRKTLLQKKLICMRTAFKAIDGASSGLNDFDAGKEIDKLQERFPQISKEFCMRALTTPATVYEKVYSEKEVKSRIGKSGELNCKSLGSGELNCKSLGSGALSWAEQPYEQMKLYAEQKKIITSRGLAVRSKSEAIIAEKLYTYNLAFRYEQILEIDGISWAPDFTILRSDGKLFYWEHMGMMSNEVYREKQINKLRVYCSAGITPWDNLIITFDNENGICDIRLVEAEIINKLMM